MMSVHHILVHQGLYNLVVVDELCNCAAPFKVRVFSPQPGLLRQRMR